MTNKLPQTMTTNWFTTQKFILSQFWNLDIWNQGVWKAMCLPKFQLSFPASADCWQSLVFIGLQYKHSFVYFCCHVVSFPVSPLSVCLIFPLIRNTSDWFRDHLNPVWPHFNLIISIRTLFLRKVTFTGSQWTWILGNYYSTQFNHEGNYFF